MRQALAVALLLLSATFVLAPHGQTPASGTLPGQRPAQTPSQTPTTQQSPTQAATPGSQEPGSLPEQTVGQTAPRRPTSTPYTGDLSVFEEPNRDHLLQVQRVMDTLRLRPGSSVADIGAGGGWFSVRAARRVGPSGHVYAEDINPRAIQTIRDRAARELLPEITPVLGTPDDPRLPAHTLDAVLMLRVYHEVARPDLMLPHILAALKPNGRFAVIDHPGNGADHGINPEVVRTEATRAGLHFVGQYDFTKGDQNDYMLVFDKLR